MCYHVNSATTIQIRSTKSYTGADQESQCNCVTMSTSQAATVILLTESFTGTDPESHSISKEATVILLTESYIGTAQESQCNAVTMSTPQAATVCLPLLSTCCMYYFTTALIHNHYGFLDSHKNGLISSVITMSL